MSARVVTARPLTAEAFAPFGQVISAGLSEGSSANQGTAVRFDWAAQLENARGGARPNLAVFRSQPQQLPREVLLLERHPHSSQAFLPLVCARYMVVVAPDGAGGGPDVARVQAFLCAPGQGINYRRGVWHHPMIALDAPADFAMLAWEDGTAGDCQEQALAAAERFTLAI